MDAKNIKVSYGHIYSPKFLREKKDIFDPDKGLGFSSDSGILSLVHEGFGADIHLDGSFLKGYRMARGDEKVLGKGIERRTREELSDSLQNLKELERFMDRGRLQSDLYFHIDRGRVHFFDYWIGIPSSDKFIDVVDKLNVRIMDPKYLEIVNLRKHLSSNNQGVPAFVGDSLKEATEKALNFYNRCEEVEKFIELAK